MIETEKQKQKRVATKMFLATEEKVKKQTLKDFIRVYSYYINNIMMQRMDPYITEKRKQYLMQVDINKLSKFANVFTRLNVDTKEKVIEKLNSEPGLLDRKNSRQNYLLDILAKKKSVERKDKKVLSYDFDDDEFEYQEEEVPPELQAFLDKKPKNQLHMKLQNFDPFTNQAVTEQVKPHQKIAEVEELYQQLTQQGKRIKDTGVIDCNSIEYAIT